MTISHKRLWYFAFILVNIPIGLATRWYGKLMPALIADYGGDALYATLIFFCIRFLLVKKSHWKVAVWAYLICVLIELQQLYRAPWAVALRDNNAIAGLILGHGFLWSDLVCYFIGVLVGLGVGLLFERASVSNTSLS